MVKQINKVTKLVHLLVPLLFSRLLSVKSAESSEDYLRNVMVELQGLKSSSALMPIYPNLHRHHQPHYLAGKRLSVANHAATVPANALPAVAVYHQDVPRVQTIGFTAKKVEPVEIMETASNNQYYETVPRPIVVPGPTKPLGYNKNELATMYKQALESGSAINLSSLKNALESGQFPSIVNNQLEFPGEQQYAYYFYPFKSFMSNLQDNYGYKTITDLIPQHPSALAPETHKQIVINPLFMAISSFVGMALLFMFGVIVLPRIFGEFKSRLVHDEFVELTKTVTEAIDNYNSSTLRPNKTESYMNEAVVGIKTRPGHRVKRKKPYRTGRQRILLNKSSREGSL